MANVFTLQSSCGTCGGGGDLYASQCSHLTLCMACGKTMAEKADPCKQCGVPLTRLIKEFPVRVNQSNKNYYVGKFLQGMPVFGGKKATGTTWTMHKEAVQNRNISDAARERLKNKPWILEDDIGQSSFQGHLEGGQTAAFYYLAMQGKDFVAYPTTSWYNFTKQLQYKTMSLEEAEDVMNHRRKKADIYKKWLMKGAGEGGGEGGSGGDGRGGGRGGRKVKSENDDEYALDLSDREEEGEDDQERKNKSGKGKGQKGEGDDDEETAPKEEVELDDDDGDKGDDWEHEETFTDDDEAVGIEKEEGEDEEAAKAPPPKAIKDEEEEEEGEEGERVDEEEDAALLDFFEVCKKKEKKEKGNKGARKRRRRRKRKMREKKNC